MSGSREWFFWMFFDLELIGFVLLLLGNRFELGYPFSQWGFILVLVISPLLFITSIYRIAKEREKWPMSVLGMLIAITGLLIVLGALWALRNFT